MILDNSFVEAVMDILNASEYKFDLKMYDEFLTPTLVPENAVWVYVKKQNTFLKLPNIKNNENELIIYIMNNEIITLIKHAIKRIRAIAGQYGVIVSINVLSNKNRKKTFTNIVGKYIEQKNNMDESYESEMPVPQDNYDTSYYNKDIEKNIKDYNKQSLNQKGNPMENTKKSTIIKVASRAEVFSILHKILPQIKDQLDYLKDK